MTANPRSPSIRLHCGTSSIRTMEEAVRQLRAALSKHKLPSLDAQTVGVRAFSMRLPNGEPTTSIALIVPPDSAGETFAFLLPSSAQFVAKTSLGERCTFEGNRMHGAKVEPGGSDVQLADGTYVHDVEIVPTRQANALTPRQLEVLQKVIVSVNAQDRCFRPIVFPRVRDHGRRRSTYERASDRRLRSILARFQDVQWLDFAAIQNIKLPERLKEIERCVSKTDPDMNRSALTDAMAAAGMRTPRSGPKSDKRFNL